MTNYHGGKQKIGKEFSKVIYDISIEIEEDENFKIKGYCEPFCGMLGVYQHIPELFDNHKPKLKYKAGDTNNSVILMWKEAQKGWIPPERCTENHYDKLRYNGEDSAEKGFVGHQYSFGGQYFMGYRGLYGNKGEYKKASQNVIKISEKLKKTKFYYNDYTKFSNLKGYVIYCDPPYNNRKQVYSSQEFDNKKFWKWCEDMSRYNIVFISEYKAPKEIKAEIVFSKNINLTGNQTKNRKRKENLYLL